MNRPITLRAWGVPGFYVLVVRGLARFEVLKAFCQRYPHIKPVSSTGLEIPGGVRVELLTEAFSPYVATVRVERAVALTPNLVR